MANNFLFFILVIFSIVWCSQLLEISDHGKFTITHSSSSVISLQSKDKGSGSVSSGPDSKRKKICCACPDTKKLRDECIVEHGESSCEKWIEAHRKCLRAEGFKV